MSASILNVPGFFDVFRRVIDGGQIANLRRILSGVPHRSVLDVGCGIGSFAPMTNQRYVGIDIEPQYVNYARRHYSKGGKDFMVADALNLDSQLGQFDIVAFVNMIHHLSDQEVQHLFTALKSVKPQRYMIVDVAREKGHPVTEFFRWIDRGRYFRTRAQQRKLLESAGCTVELESMYWSISHIYPHSVLIARVDQPVR
jgi:SAM-dependent methyltransferase